MTPDNETTLLPCPCCGTSPVFGTALVEDCDDRRGHLVICPGCGLRTAPVYERTAGFSVHEVTYFIDRDQSQAIAAERWNRRTNQTEAIERLERLTFYQMQDIASLLSLTQDDAPESEDKSITPILKQLEKHSILAGELLDGYIRLAKEDVQG